MPRKKQPQTIQLHPEAIAFLQQQQQLIELKQRELALMRAGFEQFVARASGVNLVAENWQLDTDHWVLRKES